jgi:nitroreductase
MVVTNSSLVWRRLRCGALDQTLNEYWCLVGTFAWHGRSFANRHFAEVPLSTTSIDVRKSPLELLLTRHSVGPKHLSAPGPTDDELSSAFAAALRAPDHGKLIPFRFVVIRDDGLARLADLFVDYGRRCGKNGDDLAQEKSRAMQAPVVLAVVARMHGTDSIPEHEQWMAVGGAVANVLNALHFMGFGAKMLSGLRAADPIIVKAFCRNGEVLVGWISVGTPRARPQARGADVIKAIVSEF